MIGPARPCDAIGALVLAAALLSWAATPAGAQSTESDATITVTPRSAAPGAEVHVQGHGWPGSELVMVEVCGNNALLGSPDCSRSTSRTISTSDDGRMSGMLTIPTPPTPCPCVVRAFVPTDTASAAIEFEVVGHPTAPVRQLAAVPPPALAMRATLEEVDSTGALFGIRPERILHLEIENLTDAPVVLPRLIASWGRTADGDGYIEVPPIDAVAAGETVALDVPFELAPAAIGSFVVAGQILGVDGTAFSIRTSSVPWGLLVVPVLLLLHLGAARLRRRLRRPVDVEVIDLGGEEIELREVVVEEQEDVAVGGALVGVSMGPSRHEDSEVAAWAAAAFAAGYLYYLPGIVPESVEAIDSDDFESAEIKGIDERDQAEIDDDGDELVGVGAGPAPRRRRTYAGLSLAVLAAVGLFRVHAAPVEPPLSTEELCDAFVRLDVVGALAGGDLQPRTAAVDQLASLGDRAPVALERAFRDLAGAVEAQADLQGADALDPDKPDAWNAATVGASRFEADRQFVDAATQVEQYAVNECGVPPSGRFDVAASDAISGSDAGPALEALAQAIHEAGARHEAESSAPPVITLDLPELRDAMNQRQG